jgi:FMN-dependent NADH-azoreductase
MGQALVISSSSGGEASVSRRLVRAAVAHLKAADPDVHILERDLGADPTPHLTTARVAGVRGKPRSQQELASRALSDQLIAELKAADTIVIGSPMYNFSIPTGLKAWFDHVVRAGETFAYVDGRAVGLLKGKRAILILTRGGVYRQGPHANLDFQEPYLRLLLGFMGVTDVEAVHAEQLAFGPGAQEAAVAAAEERLAEVIERPAVGAA